MGQATTTLEVRPDLAEVARVQAALSRLWEQEQLPKDLEMPVSLALEEALSNVMRHGSSRSIELRLEVKEGAFEFEVADDGEPFDPMSLPPFDATRPLSERRAGGMGVHIVRQLADKIQYERRDGRNRLVFRKRLYAAL